MRRSIQLDSNATLAGTVVLHTQTFNQIVRALGGALHRDHARNLLADCRIEEALEQLNFEAGRHDFFEDALGRRNKFVL